MADSAPSTSAPAPGPSATPRRQLVYAEEAFKGADLTRSVHLGWGVMGGVALIMFSMVMSAVTQGRSWNVSFLWLQRRVGAQFGTLSYLVTSNLLYYNDGDKWVTRDWAAIMQRYSSKRRYIQPAGTSAPTPTFAASGLREGA